MAASKVERSAARLVASRAVLKAVCLVVSKVDEKDASRVEKMVVSKVVE